MAHELTSWDDIVLHKTGAWHGMGTIVDDAPNAMDALRIAKLDWRVEQLPISATMADGRVITSDRHLMNVRSDSGHELGIVGNDWVPFQNEDVASFIDSLVELDDQIQIETAGSIRGGQKIWFLVKGESFSVRGRNDGDDVLHPYICVSNGFDGKTGFRVTPTSIRVVCSNTLHMVIPQTEGRRFDIAGYQCKHLGTLDQKLEEAKAALALYGRSLDTNKRMIDTLAAKQVDSESVKQFFLDAYTKQFGSIDVDAIDTKSKRGRDKALNAFNDYKARFDKESDQFGATAWVMLNAYTGLVQHDMGRNRNAFLSSGASESKTNSNLFGLNATRSTDAYQMALSV